ncbi:MAG TPA: hypothetical protein VGB47_13110 [Thermoanaerobaculia bacterium]|jgi:hypothetical protein
MPPGEREKRRQVGTAEVNLRVRTDLCGIESREDARRAVAATGEEDRVDLRLPDELPISVGALGVGSGEKAVATAQVRRFDDAVAPGGEPPEADVEPLLVDGARNRGDSDGRAGPKAGRLQQRRGEVR